MQTTKSYKIVLLGDSGVGKTANVKYCLIHSEEGNGTKAEGQLPMVTGPKVKSFEPKHNPTVGCEVYTFNIYPSDKPSHKVSMAVWDCAGDERFLGAPEVYYKDADVAIIVGQNEEKWKQRVKEVSPNVRVVAYRDPEPDMFLRAAQMVRES
jgi:GTPase SAR1 family protein